MKVRELILQLQQLPQDNNIVITAMDDNFFIQEFEVASPKENEAQEIILNCYVDDYSLGE